MKEGANITAEAGETQAFRLWLLLWLARRRLLSSQARVSKYPEKKGRLSRLVKAGHKSESEQ
jgi:hypothetical protein